MICEKEIIAVLFTGLHHLIVSELLSQYICIKWYKINYFQTFINTKFML